LGGALDRAEHAAVRGGIEDAMRRRKSQAVQFRLDCPIPRRANNGDLFNSGRLPLGNQVAEHRGALPRQQQFGPSHAPGSPGAEHNRAQ
jgi:hypothetical protein